MGAALDLRTIARALGGEVSGRQVLAPGPNHGRDDRSLAVKPDAGAPDGFTVFSHANDEFAACRDYVRERLGIPKWEPNRTAPGMGAPSTRYVYYDAEGQAYLRVTRTADKKFWQHHWDGREWARGAPSGPKVPYRLPDLLAAVTGAPVYVCEGEKNTDAVRALGLVATTNSEGAGKWTDDLSPFLADRTCYVLEDNDAAGAKHVRKVAESLAGVAAEVRVVKLPGLKPKGDVSDWIDAGGTAEALGVIARSFPIYDPAAAPEAEEKPKRPTAPPPRGANDDRPTITIRAGEISEAVDAAEAALIARGGLYQRGNQIVFMGEAPVITHDATEVTVSRIFERGENALAEDITRAACLMKWDARVGGDVVTDCPARLVQTLRERTGRFQFPILTAVINAPTLRPDGSLLAAPGYDKTTGLFLDPRGIVFPAIPAAPSQDDAIAALDVLGELLAGFPFEDEASRSVAFSTILTACTRRAVSAAPLHAFSAPVAGSGKSKLVDIASVIATGRQAGVTDQAADDAETQKRMEALYLQGASMIAIDNCTFPVGGSFLCQALTQPYLSIRRLGTHDPYEVPASALLTATGNNLVIAGDVTRRAVVARLDPHVERPELRTFAFDPVAKAKADRVRYVSAALTILRAYQVAGAPRKLNPLGSFEGWSRMVRDALVWVGCADPVSTMEGARDLDPKLQELSEIITQWRSVVGADRITARKLIDKANKQGGSDGYDYNSKEFRYPDLREALLTVAGQGGVINARRLGKWLQAHAKRITGGAWIEQDGLSDGLMTWALREKRS